MLYQQQQQQRYLGKESLGRQKYQNKSKYLNDCVANHNYNDNNNGILEKRENADPNQPW